MYLIFQKLKSFVILLVFRLSSDEETFRAKIHVKLKEIMLQVDLDEVTSKFVNNLNSYSFRTKKIKNCFFLFSISSYVNN